MICIQACVKKNPVNHNLIEVIALEHKELKEKITG